MKKIISVLILIAAVMMLSSCVWVFNPDESTTNYYNITCHNVSDTTITDWCVVRNGKRTYAKSGGCSPIAAHTGTSTIYNIPEGNYILYVSFVSNKTPDYDNGDYVKSKEFPLSKNYDVYIDQTFVDDYLHQ